MSETYDVVAVGGGTAGCIVAARLGEHDDLARRREQCGNEPVIVADVGTEPNLRREGLPDHAARGVDYGAAMNALLGEPGFAGWRWCGHLENTGGRGRGLKDPWDEPYRPLTDAIAGHNRRAAAYRKGN